MHKNARTTMYNCTLYNKKKFKGDPYWFVHVTFSGGPRPRHKIYKWSMSLKRLRTAGVVYKPPHTDTEKFLTSFAGTLSSLNNENRPCYLLGDYNFDILKCTSKHNQSFINQMMSYGFIPKIDRPTRISEFSATLIDNIFTNCYQNSTEAGLWLSQISDHLPIFIIAPISPGKIKRATKYVQKRCYSIANMNKFKALLSNTNWTSVYEAAYGTDNQYSTFEKVIHELHEECFPLKNVKLNPRSDCKPWISPAILRSIRKKNNMYKKCLTNESPDFLAKYRKYKNILTSTIR